MDTKALTRRSRSIEKTYIASQKNRSWRQSYRWTWSTPERSELGPIQSRKHGDKKGKPY